MLYKVRLPIHRANAILTARHAPDPDITVRRKTIFLFSALIVPNETSAPPNTLPNVHGPESHPPNDPAASPAANDSTPSHASAQPIHANSHAAHLRNPRQTSTSPQTLQAFQKYGISDAVISSLVNPVPYGEDGDQDGPDSDFEEKGVR